MPELNRNTLTIHVGHLPGNLDALAEPTLEKSLLIHNLSDRLFEPSRRHSLRPNLIKSYSCSLDERTWKFELQRERFFHNGQELTVDDVLFTLEQNLRTQRSQADLADFFEILPKEIPALRKKSRYKFEITLRRRCANFLERLALDCMSVRWRGSTAEAPVFSGPFEIVERTEQCVRLRANANHPFVTTKTFSEICIRPMVAEPDIARLLGSSTIAICDGWLPVSSDLLASTVERHVIGDVGLACYLVFRRDTPNLPFVRHQLLRTLGSRKGLAGTLLARPNRSIFPNGTRYFAESDRTEPKVPDERLSISLDLSQCGAGPLLKRVLAGLHDEMSIDFGATSEPHGILRSTFLGEAWAGMLARHTFLSEGYLRGFNPTFLQRLLDKAENATTPEERTLGLKRFFRELVCSTGIVPLFFAPTILFYSDDLDASRPEMQSWPLSFLEVRRSKVVTREDLRAARLEAIARTTQMFAHDVRKPFSMLKMALNAMEAATDPQEIAQIVQKLVPEVQRAMASVDGMIADVMEIGSDAPPRTEQVEPVSLVETALHEIFRIHRGCEIQLDFQFQHQHRIDVDPLRVARVFANILSNAIEAMKKRGRIWFRTREIFESGVLVNEFCIGNSDSHIPDDVLPHVFDAFFTRGKRGGTGLGLAIAEKIVSEHGGRIRCQSSQERGVEFFFTLPCASDKSIARSQKLPRHSQEIEERILESIRAPGTTADALQQENTLIKEISNLVSQTRRRLRVLCVDDEAVYRNSLKTLLSSNKPLADAVDVHMAKCSESALELAGRLPMDVIICDIDLGAESRNGFEIVSELRGMGSQAQICVHSNRSLPEDFKTAIEAGANAFLPKPMSQAHLLRLLVEAARSRVLASACGPDCSEAIALVDDSPLVRTFWLKKLQADAMVYTFRSPVEFRQKCTPELLKTLRCLVTDYRFDDECEENGLEFAASVRNLAPALPIFLCSEASFRAGDLPDCIDGLLDKDPLTWDQLAAKIANVRAKGDTP